jgi:excisionase family DNA binding protein
VATKTFTVTTDDLISPPQAAKLLGVHHASVYRWIEAGKLMAFHTSTRTFLNKKHVEEFKERREREGVVVFTVRRPIKKKTTEI